MRSRHQGRHGGPPSCCGRIGRPSLAQEPISRELAGLGLRVAEPAELDALLEGFLAGGPPLGCIKVSAREYSDLSLAVDRLFIDNAAGTGVRPLAARARRSPHDTVRLVQG
jgi:hypothetical protein